MTDLFTKEITCVQCPLGCLVEVGFSEDGATIKPVAGAQCARGKAFAAKEAVSPVRILTMVVPVRGVLMPLSVKTSAPVPKALLADIAEVVSQLRMSTPIVAGDILIRNVLDSGVDVVATKSVG